MEPISAITEGLKKSAPFLTILKGFFKESKGEFDDWFRIGLSNYIEDRKNKYSRINTFIFRTEKVDFYNTYFEVSIGYKNKQLSSNNLLESLFSNSNFAAIIGVAGSGKTMLMKHGFLSAYGTLYAIPIFIELRDLNHLNIPLIEYIYTIILDNRIKATTRLVERALEEGGFIFFLDGFDEINLEKKESIILEIERFTDRFNKNKFIISSRPGAKVESIPRFEAFHISQLNQDQIIEFINKQLKDLDDRELVDKLITTVKSPKNIDYLEYLKNPLLLSMFILTFRYYPELPKSKSKFYWNVFDTLSTKHDSISKRGGYTHEKKTGLQNEEVEKILKVFCFYTVAQMRFNFDEHFLNETLLKIKNKLKIEYKPGDLIYDLELSISILIKEGLDYKFPHRTIQDYFMVLFVKELNDFEKRKVFENSFEQIYPHQGNKNIFDLFMEIDKIAYIEYYLIPLFEKFHKIYTLDEPIKNYALLLQESKASYIITIGKNTFRIGRVSRLMIKHVYVSEYFNLAVPSNLRNDGKLDESCVLTLLENHVYTVDKKTGEKVYQIEAQNISFDDWLPFVKEIYNKTSVVKFFSNMKNIHEMLQKELKEGKDLNNSILNFEI